MKLQNLPSCFPAVVSLTAAKSTRLFVPCWLLIKAGVHISVLLPIPGRPARGEIKDLAEFKAKDYDAVIFPGGFGAALNLSDFAVNGAECDVNVEVRRAIEESYREGIVIGAMCIAPTVIARVLGKHGITITVGNDKKVAAGLAKMGARHQDCAATEVCVDSEHKIVTTPCYMLANSLKDICTGTRNLVDEMLELIDY